MNGNAPVKLSMLVKGITPTLFEAGKVKIGRKGKERQGQNGTWQAPEKLDHFLITRTLRGQDNNFLLDEGLIAKLPKDADDKLRRIPITLLYDDMSLNFQSRYACYLGKTLFCSGDGETANEAIADQNKKVSGYKQVPCICRRAEFGYEGRDKCKITGKLQFVIRGAERIGGVHVYRTTGRNSVVSIMSSLAMIQRITGGLLAGIPLELVVNPKQVSDPNGAQQTVYVVSIEFAGSMQTLQDSAHKILLENAKYGIQIGRIEDEARALLTAQPTPFGETLDEEDEGEFFPNAHGLTSTHVETVDTDTGDILPSGSSLDDVLSSAAESAPVIPPKAQKPALEKPVAPESIQAAPVTEPAKPAKQAPAAKVQEKKPEPVAPAPSQEQAESDPFGDDMPF